MTNFVRIAAILVVFSATLMACAGKSAGEHVDDSWIHAQVKAQLPPTGGLGFNIEVNRGVVQISGFTSDAELRQSVPRKAATVNGVRKVINQIHMVEPGRSAGTRLDDGTITARVKSLLASADLPNNFPINVEVYDGQVLLSGFVNSNDDRDQAVAIASDTKGVKKVINGMNLRPVD